MSRSSKIWSVIAAIALVIAGLAFTAPGHRMLYKVGFATACDGGDCN